MKTLFVVAVMCENSVLNVDGLRYKEKLWLVPRWLDYPLEKMSKPERMIRFDTLPFQELTENSLHDFLLQQPIPKAVLGCETTEGFEVRLADEITFGIQTDILRKRAH
jgi:hypothetical protein